MEVEAKITAPEQKRAFWFAVWDRTKYCFNRKRIAFALVILFTFFISYTLLCAMSRIDLENRSAMVPPIFYTIPEILSPGPGNALLAGTSRDLPKANRSKPAKPAYAGPQVIYRELIGIPPGTLAKARLVTGASDGPVRAEILQDVVVRGERVIESGSQIMGNGNSTDERLFLRFEQLVKLDGTTLTIQAQALDGTDRIAGIKGNKVSTEATKLAAGIGLNFVGGMSDALQETEVKGGVAVKSNSAKNALLNGTTHAALDQSKELISAYKEKAPRIEVEKGRIIHLIFDAGGR